MAFPLTDAIMADPKKMTDSSGKWSSLPSELVDLIGKKIDIHSDYVRFRAVCVPWRSALPATPNHLPRQIPWILLQTLGGGDGRCPVIEAVSNKRHLLRLPEILRRHQDCRGSSDGWIVMVESFNTAVVAVNPLTGAEFNLPPPSELPIYVKVDSNSKVPAPGRGAMSQSLPKKVVKNIKITLSYRRLDDYLAVAILRSKVGEFFCCKSGQYEWIRVPAGSADSIVEEALLFQGLVYAVEKNGSITVCDVSCDPPNVVAYEEMGMEELQSDGHDVNLVSANHDLFLVARFFCNSEARRRKTVDFKVYRLSCWGNTMWWERVNDLEGRALFVGGDRCSTVAVMASDFAGCKPNSIYYSAGKSVGNFSLEDGANEKSYGASASSPHWIWFTPNPL